MPPPKRFSKTSIDARLLQAWIILTGRARNRQTITYGELSKLMLGEKASAHGKRAPQWKGMSLGQLFTYCRRNDLPLLPVIVVSAENGEPAEKDLYGEIEIGREREKVYKFDWYDVYPPSETDRPDY